MHDRVVDKLLFVDVHVEIDIDVEIEVALVWLPAQLNLIWC